MREDKDMLSEMVKSHSNFVELFSPHGDSVGYMDASISVAYYLATHFGILERFINNSNVIREQESGEPVVKADPLVGGLVMHLCGVLMDDRNGPGLDKVAEEFSLPAASRAGLRERLDKFFDALGLRRDEHLYN